MVKAEEKKEEVKTPEETQAIEDNVKYTTPLIEIANAAAKRMEDANKETARLFKQQEQRDARIALGGEGGGHAEVKLISEKDLKKQEAAKFFAGTELEEAINKL